MQNVTRKDLHRYFNYVFYTGYCELQYLLDSDNKIGYNAGVYGWNWSAYRCGGGVVINTGYRNMTGDRIPYELCDRYDHLAKLALGKPKLREKLLERLIRETKRALYKK